MPFRGSDCPKCGPKCSGETYCKKFCSCVPKCNNISEKFCENKCKCINKAYDCKYA